MTLIATRLADMRAKSKLDKNENRGSRYGALDMFMQQSEDPAGILTPELKAKARASMGSTLQTPVFKYDAGVTIGNTRTAIIADSENTSALFTITFTTLAWGFTVVPAMYSNNELSEQEDFEVKMRKNINKLGVTLDAAAITALGANKTQVFANELGYTVTGNAIQCPYTGRENLIGDLNPIMAANDHYGTIHLLGNGGVESLIRKMAEKGLYNEVNKQLEYSDKVIHFSSRITNAVGEYANMFAVQEGSLGMLTRFERDAERGTVSRTGHEWGIEVLPELNLAVGTYYYEGVSDYSAIAGAATADLTRTVKQHYGFAVDVAFITPYNSDATTIASPIVKATILAAV